MSAVSYRAELARAAEALREAGWVVIPPSGRPRSYPGLTVGARWVCWRGERIGLSRREGQVIAALAASWPDPLTSRDIHEAVWGSGFDRSCVSGYIGSIRARAPGLIVRIGPGGGGWTLDLPEGSP